jgi:hypothetical protein
MKLNQSDEEQRNKPLLNNSHPSRQVDSGGDEDHFTKAPNANGDLKRRFIKAPDLKNGGLKKQAKAPNIIHPKDRNQTKKAWWRPPANGVQITPANEVKKRPLIEGFSGGQYGFFKACPSRHATHGNVRHIEIQFFI